MRTILVAGLLLTLAVAGCTEASDGAGAKSAEERGEAFAATDWAPDASLFAAIGIETRLALEEDDYADLDDICPALDAFPAGEDDLGDGEAGLWLFFFSSPSEGGILVGVTDTEVVACEYEPEFTDAVPLGYSIDSTELAAIIEAEGHPWPPAGTDFIAYFLARGEFFGGDTDDPTWSVLAEGLDDGDLAYHVIDARTGEYLDGDTIEIPITGPGESGSFSGGYPLLGNQATEPFELTQAAAVLFVEVESSRLIPLDATTIELVDPDGIVHATTAGGGGFGASYFVVEGAQEGVWRLESAARCPCP